MQNLVRLLTGSALSCARCSHGSSTMLESVWSDTVATLWSPYWRFRVTARHWKYLEVVNLRGFADDTFKWDRIVTVPEAEYPQFQQYKIHTAMCSGLFNTFLPFFIHVRFKLQIQSSSSSSFVSKCRVAISARVFIKQFQVMFEEQLQPPTLSVRLPLPAQSFLWH